MRTKNCARSGFTIVELLTVISIIVIIITMIVPGINYTRRIARELKVRAQIKGLSEGVEAFYSDNDFYPPSNRSRWGSSTVYTCGAQKFAAALVGVDLLGHDPQGDFDLETCERNPKAYAVVGVGGATDADRQRSLDRRRQMYVTPTPELVASDLEFLYGTGSTGNLYPGGDRDNKKMGPVLCDALKVKEVEGYDGKTLNAGTPFLYFKANQDTRKYGETDGTWRDDGYVYNWLDNKDLLELMPLSGATKRDGSLMEHEWSPTLAADAGRKAFYEALINPAITTEARPYNMTTYIIISAGTDGVFGTKDDITNLGR